MDTPGWLGAKQRALAAAQPLSVHLELTYACNWACVFCYNPRRHDLRRLSGAEWLVVLDDLRALGTLTVTLTGGEPLRHPDFLAIAAGARERAFALRVFTNGALVDDPTADALAALHPVGVEMSLHGARAATHDGTTGRPGSWEAMLCGLDRLVARGVTVSLKTPVTRLNEEEIAEMIALAEARRVPYRLDAALTPRDDGDRGPLAYAATPVGVERMYRALAARGALPQGHAEAGGVNCGLGRITMAIDPDGNVFPCMQWRASSLGNVRDRPLRQLWNVSPVRAQAAAVSRATSDRLAGIGGDLAEFPYCPALAAQHTGDPLTPDPDHIARASIVGRIRAEAAR